MIAIVQSPSTHFDARACAVDCLILHYTGTVDAATAADYYLGRAIDGAGRIAPHYMIDYDGTVVQFVDEGKRAWHAGKSFWAGRDDLNSRSVGIELVNPGHAGGYVPFTAAQMESLSDLCHGILSRHAIPAKNVLAHSDIAPGRKDDPGELMDWFFLAARGIGLWPQPQTEDYKKADTLIADQAVFTRALHDYGYDPSAPLTNLLRSFQRHYHPECFTAANAGAPNAESAARLCWLLRCG